MNCPYALNKSVLVQNLTSSGEAEPEARVSSDDEIVPRELVRLGLTNRSMLPKGDRPLQALCFYIGMTLQVEATVTPDKRTSTHTICREDVTFMCKPHGVSRFVSVVILMALTGVIGSVPPATAGSVGALVPAYFYPGTGGPGGVGDGWAAMAAAAATIPVTAIFNPDSGPLPGPPDPNYVNALTNLENAGGKVVAYVYTDYGNISLATVEGQISTYITQYGRLINGFFTDGMSTDPSVVPYYQALYSFVKGLSSSYDVIGNPGTATNPSYLAASPPTANTFLTYEGSAADYTSANTSMGASSLYANTIYDQLTVEGMQADVAFAAQHNVGYVYVTDQTLPNPYDQLPSYWDQEVAAISAASVPEPGSMAIMASGCMLMALGIAVRHRARSGQRGHCSI